MKESLGLSTIIGDDKKVHLEHLRQNGGYFQRFEWLPDEFERKHDADRQDLIDQKIRECNIHPMPFNASQNKRLLKHEYPF